jgi:hypothetical protein
VCQNEGVAGERTLCNCRNPDLQSLQLRMYGFTRRGGSSCVHDVTNGWIAYKYATFIAHDDFSNSALPCLMVAYRTVVPSELADANGVLDAESDICLISSLILRVTAS